MRLLVAGASGRTGRLLTKLALEHGHEVTVLVRKASDFPCPRHDRLQVVVGDVLDAQTLAPAVAGQDAAVSVLAPRPRTNGRVYVEGTRNLANALANAGLRRLVVVSAEGAGADRRSLTLSYRLVLRIPVLARLYPDIARMEDELRARTDLEWTVVRPPILSNGPQRGGYREAVGPVLPNGMWLSRSDLAQALLDITEQGTYVCESVAVAY